MEIISSTCVYMHTNGYDQEGEDTKENDGVD